MKFRPPKDYTDKSATWKVIEYTCILFVCGAIVLAAIHALVDAVVEETRHPVKYGLMDEYRVAEVMSRQAETKVEKDYREWKEGKK